MTAPRDDKPGTLLDWLAIAGGMLGCFMAVLDIQIMNSSLAQIEGAVGASIDEGSWISTAYLIAEIIVIPLTGWLTFIFGFRRYLSVNTALFVLFSIGCAMSSSLNQLILFRTGQGFTGGVLIPSAINLVRARLPPRQQLIGVSLFGVAATFAPAIGPTIGGWLTEQFSWRFIFYLNIPPGIAAIALQLVSMKRERMRLAELKDGDWPGIAAMAIGLGALTVVLEEGQRHDWLDSPMIAVLAVVAAVAIVFFLIFELTAEKPFLNLRLLTSRTVGTGNLLSLVLGTAAFGSMYLVPVYLAQVPHFGSRQIASVVMWSGLPQFIVFPLIPFLMRTVPLRTLSAFGAILFTASCFANAHLTHQVGGNELIFPQMLRAFAFPLFAVPMMQMATSGLSERDTADASALTNMFRNLGGSIGIALLSSLTQSREEVHFATITSRVTANAAAVNDRVDMLTAAMTGPSGDSLFARLRALAQLEGQIRQEALVMAYSDAFTIIGIMLVVSMIALFFLPKDKPTAAPMLH